MPEIAKMKPLIFGPRSILAWQQGAKTQTRRLVKPQPKETCQYLRQQQYDNRWAYWRRWDNTGRGYWLEKVRQPYAVGDLLWIREGLVRSDDDMVLYAADGIDCPDPSHRIDEVGLPQAIWTWERRRLPAMFMPKWACRYYARVISVRPERLRDISDADALAEGTLVEHEWRPSHYEGGEHDLYLTWWDELHRKPEHKSEANPIVWRYGLEKADAS